MLLALTRPVSPAIARCELTHLARTPIDAARAREQHAAYERALAAAGCRVERIAAGDDLPDSVFIEDTAVVLDEIAIVTRPGAPSRRGEVAAVADILRQYRDVAAIEEPGTLDGGDVLVVGRRLFAGRSTRTNDSGIEQLRAAAARHGYTTEAVDVRGCLHLKSAVTVVDDDALLVNPDWIPTRVFDEFNCVAVDPAEPLAANALRVESRIVYPESFPATCDRLERYGFSVQRVDVSELQKAEGAVTCCSLVFRT